MIPAVIVIFLEKGSKPRASGDDPQDVRSRMRRRMVNPARAGMILENDVNTIPAESKPRASGDDPVGFEGEGSGAT